MYGISDNYKTYINNSFARSPKSKIVIDGVEYLDNVIMSCPSISHNNDTFIGGFPSKTCSFEIKDIDGTLTLNNKWITVYRGLYIDGATEWILMGIFRAISDEDITTNKSKKTITFKGYDKRQLLDTPYTSSLDWSTSHTGLEIVQEACSNVGLELESTVFNFAAYEFTQQPNFPSDITNTEVISRMAEIGGEIALITREGKVHIKGPNITDVLITKAKRNTLTQEMIFGPITMLVLGNEGYDDDVISGTEGVEWRIENNPYVELVRESIIETIAPFIIGRSIIPFELNDTVDDFYLDINDNITIANNDGTTFVTTILGYDTNNRIKSTIQAPVQTKTLSNYGIAGGSKQALNKVKLEVNHIDKKITSLIEVTENIESDIGNIRDEFQTEITSIEQNQEEILMTALKDYTSKTEFEAYQETVSTEFRQTAEDFSFNFDNLTTQINTINGTTQEQIQEIHKYIRFEDGNIILGESGSELTLKIENDRIAFIQNNNEVAYFSNNKLNVTDGEFLNSLTIGNFAFKPRNNGNLSLLYVGGDS